MPPVAATKTVASAVIVIILADPYSDGAKIAPNSYRINDNLRNREIGPCLDGEHNAAGWWSHKRESNARARGGGWEGMENVSHHRVDVGILNMSGGSVGETQNRERRNEGGEGGVQEFILLTRRYDPHHLPEFIRMPPNPKIRSISQYGRSQFEKRIDDERGRDRERGGGGEREEKGIFG